MLLSWGGGCRTPTGCRNNDVVATASVTEPVPRTPASRPNLVSVGTIIWLSSELMFFAGLFAMFFTVKAQNTAPTWPPPPVELDYKISIPATVILVLSSITCQFGVFAAERGDVFALRRWYSLTFVMGLIFLAGQAYEYYSLVTEHHTTISSSAWGSVFFLATGFHGLHVAGGLVAFIILMTRTKLSKFPPAQATATIVVSYY